MCGPGSWCCDTESVLKLAPEDEAKNVEDAPVAESRSASAKSHPKSPASEAPRVANRDGSHHNEHNHGHASHHDGFNHGLPSHHDGFNHGLPSRHGSYNPGLASQHGGYNHGFNNIHGYNERHSFGPQIGAHKHGYESSYGYAPTPYNGHDSHGHFGQGSAYPAVPSFLRLNHVYGGQLGVFAPDFYGPEHLHKLPEHTQALLYAHKYKVRS